jgi:type IV pilus assembly protein PilN
LIKINLLPVARATKKVAVNEVQLQVVAGLAVTLVLVVLCGLRWQMLSEQVIEQTQLREVKKIQLAELKKQVVEVENYEKNRKLLENKNRVIEQLRKNQGGPVRLLDHISQSLDPLKIWLTTVDDGGSQISIDGRAFATDDVVEFVKSLQASEYFSSVLLEESRQSVEDGLGIYQFRLRLMVKG